MESTTKIPASIMKLLRAKELAEYLHLSLSTIYSWAKTAGLPCKKIRGCLLFDLDAVMNWIDSIDDNNNK